MALYIPMQCGTLYSHAFKGHIPVLQFGNDAKGEIHGGFCLLTTHANLLELPCIDMPPVSNSTALGVSSLVKYTLDIHVHVPTHAHVHVCIKVCVCPPQDKGVCQQNGHHPHLLPCNVSQTMSYQRYMPFKLKQYLHQAFPVRLNLIHLTPLHICC